jgi:hypothetical protein
MCYELDLDIRVRQIVSIGGSCGPCCPCKHHQSAVGPLGRKPGTLDSFSEQGLVIVGIEKNTCEVGFQWNGVSQQRRG